MPLTNLQGKIQTHWHGWTSGWMLCILYIESEPNGTKTLNRFSILQGFRQRGNDRAVLSFAAMA